jgi:PAS domain S-box-containing protein
LSKNSSSNKSETAGLRRKAEESLKKKLLKTTSQLSEIEALRESELRFRTLFESANDSLFLMDQDVFIDCNPKTLEMFGCTREQIIGKPPYLFSPEVQPDGRKSREKAQEKIEAALKGQPQFFEWKHSRYDGTLFDAEVSLNVFCYTGKYCLQAIVRDITNRKLSEKTISMLAQAVRSVSECVSITDMMDKIIFVNSAFLKTYQYEEHELKGKSISIVRSPNNSLDYVNEILPATLQGGWQGEVLNMRKDGSEFPAFVSTSVIQDENGQPLALIGVTTDISERKKAEKELLASETRNKALLNAIPDLMFMFNRDGIFVDFHTPDPKSLITRPKDFLGRSIADVLPQELAELTMSHLQEVFEKGKTSVYEYSIIMGNEELIYESRIVGCGNDLALSIVRDISDRKKMEYKMIQSERLTALGEMSAGMAHEINQPLNTLSILFDNILFEAKQSHSVSEEYLVSKSDKIYNNILRIRNLIDHVRDFSRSREGYIFTPFNINESILNALSMVTGQFKIAGITLKINLDENLPQVKGNTYKFEQVMLNLILNSKDALIEKKNELNEPYPMFIKITTKCDSEKINIHVEDNGTGIKDEHRDKIFQPFYTTKETGKGTGLGLSISHSLVREINGEIDIQSKVHEGTIISITIPLESKNK